MNGNEKRQRLISTMSNLEVPIIGNIVFWNVRNVDITKDQFVEMLKASGLPEKYAKEHNYRSAFIRALGGLEENRIIRKVSEDNAYIVYQFTAEDLTKAVGDRVGQLTYRYETRVIVDKNRYYETRRFDDAIVREIKAVDSQPGYVADPEVTKKVIALYDEERVRYRSGDVTRYVQRILTEEADIIPLRDQGNVYFVPAQFQEVVEKVAALVAKLSPVAENARFDFLPVPDAAGPRGTVTRSAVEEIRSIIREIAEEIALAGPEDINAKRWSQTRLDRLERVKERIGMYTDIVPEDKIKDLTGRVDELANQIFSTRKIEV